MVERTPPTLSQFGLSEGDVVAVENYEKRVERNMAVIAFGGPAVGWALYGLSILNLPHTFAAGILAGLLALGFFLFAWVVLTLLTAMPAVLILGPLFRLISPAPASPEAVRRYKDAVADFKAWKLRTQREHWLSLSGRQFELELALLFNGLGWRAITTGRSGDGGIDLEVLRDGKRTIVQCKAHNRPVGPGAIRELYGTLLSSGAAAGMVASVSGFSEAARSFAAGKPIELLDLPWIVERQNSLRSAHPVE